MDIELTGTEIKEILKNEKAKANLLKDCSKNNKVREINRIKVIFLEGIEESIKYFEISGLSPIQDY